MTPREGWSHLLRGDDVDRIRDVAEQLDLLAYLIAHAAAPNDGSDARPRAVDLRLPSPGLEAMLRGFSATLLSAMDGASPAIVPPERQP